MKIIRFSYWIASFTLLFGLLANTIQAAPTNTGNCQTQCKSTCENIVKQSMADLNTIKASGDIWYCHRNDPSEGLQRAYAQSLAHVDALKSAGYACIKGMPTPESYYSVCYQTCLENLCN